MTTTRILYTLEDLKKLVAKEEKTLYGSVENFLEGSIAKHEGEHVPIDDETYILYVDK